MPWLAVAAIGAAVVGGVAGAISKSNAADRADMIRNEAIQKWLKINIPDPEQQRLALEQFVVAGKLTPVMEQAIRQDPSAFEGIAQDQGLKQSRLRSLRQLESLGSGEETFGDRAAREEALIDANAAARGKQKAITNSLAERGQLGTGLELSARMDQAQADADRAARTTLGLESDRRARALKAIQAAGDLAGDISDDDYRMASDKARANDAIAAFNTTNMRDVMARNAKAKTDAQRWNLENEQNIADKNTALRNYEQQYNNELLQKKFDNETKIAAGATGQYGKAADQAVANGKNAAEFWGNLAGNVPKVISAAKEKDDDEDEDMYV